MYSSLFIHDLELDWGRALPLAKGPLVPIVQEAGCILTF
jgi:hypothetical protein